MAELRIQTVPKRMREQIILIAENLGISYSAYLKMRIQEAIDKEPETLKTKKPEF